MMLFQAGKIRSGSAWSNRKARIRVADSLGGLCVCVEGGLFVVVLWVHSRGVGSPCGVPQGTPLDGSDDDRQDLISFAVPGPWVGAWELYTFGNC